MPDRRKKSVGGSPLGLRVKLSARARGTPRVQNEKKKKEKTSTGGGKTPNQQKGRGKRERVAKVVISLNGGAYSGRGGWAGRRRSHGFRKIEGESSPTIMAIGHRLAREG